MESGHPPARDRSPRRRTISSDNRMMVHGFEADGRRCDGSGPAGPGGRGGQDHRDGGHPGGPRVQPRGLLLAPDGGRRRPPGLDPDPSLHFPGATLLRVLRNSPGRRAGAYSRGRRARPARPGVRSGALAVRHLRVSVAVGGPRGRAGSAAGAARPGQPGRRGAGQAREAARRPGVEGRRAALDLPRVAVAGGQGDRGVLVQARGHAGGGGRTALGASARPHRRRSTPGGCRAPCWSAPGSSARPSSCRFPRREI